MGIVFQTEDAWSSLVFRVPLSLVMIPHRAQKRFGWFGGPGSS